MSLACVIRIKGFINSYTCIYIHAQTHTDTQIYIYDIIYVDVYMRPHNDIASRVLAPVETSFKSQYVLSSILFRTHNAFLFYSFSLPASALFVLKYGYHLLSNTAHRGTYIHCIIYTRAFYNAIYTHI